MIKYITIEIPLDTSDEYYVEPGAQLSWVIRNFLCSICEGYYAGAPRRSQAHQVSLHMAKSAFDGKQITAAEWASLLQEISHIMDTVHPIRK